MIHKFIFNYADQKGLAYNFRKKRAEGVKNIIQGLKRDNARVRVLDIGGTEVYWRALGYDWLRENKVDITLLNVSVEVSKITTDNKDIFTAVVGDGCALEYTDAEFDLCFSNSVIEHVGDFAQMRSFATETKRVARSYYCQTPNFWFPIEPHFMFVGFQYLPEPIRVFLLRRFTLGFHVRERDVMEAWQVVQSARLIDLTAFSALFEDAKIEKERFLFLFTKSLIAVRNH